MAEFFGSKTTFLSINNLEIAILLIVPSLQKANLKAFVPFAKTHPYKIRKREIRNKFVVLTGTSDKTFSQSNFELLKFLFKNT